MTLPHQWTWEEIKQGWLGGSELAVVSEIVVEGFNRAAAVLGDAWVEAQRQGAGPFPTLAVGMRGERLRSIQRAKGRERLIQRLRAGDVAASSELDALYLVVNRDDSLEVELEPATGSKNPDFGVRRQNDDWIWFEVCRPNESDQYKALRKVMGRLTAIVTQVPVGTALELFFLREPEPGDIKLVEDAGLAFARGGGIQTLAIEETAMLFLNQHPPGQMSIDSHGIDDKRPRLGSAQALATVHEGQTVTTASVSVRIPFSSERAGGFVADKSTQLPKDSCGVLLFDLAQEPGGLSGWGELVKGRLETWGHTRVAAVALFHEAVGLPRKGNPAVGRTVGKELVENTRAAKPIPTWLRGRLSRAATNA